MKFTFEHDDLVKLAQAKLKAEGIAPIKVDVLKVRVACNHKKGMITLVLEDLQPIPIREKSS